MTRSYNIPLKNQNALSGYFTPKNNESVKLNQFEIGILVFVLLTTTTDYSMTVRATIVVFINEHRLISYCDKYKNLGAPM